MRNSFIHPVKIISLSVFLVMALSFGAMAQDEKPKKWEDEGELSVVQTSGNTELFTLAVKNTLTYHPTLKDSLILYGAALYGEDTGVKTAENYAASLRWNHDFTDRVYSYLLGGWYKDTFAGIDNRFYGGAGVGYKFLTGPKHILNLEGGLNYVGEQYTDDTDSDFAEGRAKALYEWRFTEKSKFAQVLEFLYNFKDSDKYRFMSDTAIITSLTDLLSLKVSYNVKYDNKPTPADLEKTDTILAAALVINY